VHCTAANGNTVTVSLPLPGVSGMRQFDSFDVSVLILPMQNCDKLWSGLVCRSGPQRANGGGLQQMQ
jgi:hypothetical protein